jgi:hypothetical protein
MTALTAYRVRIAFRVLCQLVEVTYHLTRIVFTALLWVCAGIAVMRGAILSAAYDTKRY